MDLMKFSKLATNRFDMNLSLFNSIPQSRDGKAPGFSKLFTGNIHAATMGRPAIEPFLDFGAVASQLFDQNTSVTETYR